MGLKHITEVNTSCCVGISKKKYLTYFGHPVLHVCVRKKIDSTCY